MKRIITLFLLFSFLATIKLVSTASPVLADGGHGALRVGFSSSPRFPIVGQEATFTFTISFVDDTPGAGQDVMVMVEKNEAGGHGHGGEAENQENAQPEALGAGSHHMADMGGSATRLPPMIHLLPEEVSPGVYQSRVSFEQGGRYIATVYVLGDEVDIIIGVRSSPVAWWYVGGLAGLVVLLAGIVAVAKTARRMW